MQKDHLVGGDGGGVMVAPTNAIEFCWCIESKNSADWCFAADRDGVLHNARFLDPSCIRSEPFKLFRLPATEQGAPVAVMVMTSEEAELLDQTIEQFCDCGETDTPYEKLLDWANRGYLECERFLALPAAQEAIDAARLAKTNGGAA